MTHEEAIARIELAATELVGTMAQTEEPSAAEVLKRYIDAYDMAIAALRAQEEQKAILVQQYIKVTEPPKWISVEERLPDEFVSVLVYMPGESPLPTVHEGFLAREGVWYANHFDREPTEITHWMPLPEKPKEEV